MKTSVMALAVVVVGAVVLSVGLTSCASDSNSNSGNSEPNSGEGASNSGNSGSNSGQLEIDPPQLEVEAIERHGFDRLQYSLSDPNSIWVVINKKRPFNPKTFEPDDLVLPDVPNRAGHLLRKEAAEAAEQLFRDAKADGIRMRITSGYRSYQTQVGLWKGFVARDGQAAADTYSARAGHSEHQTGLVIDFDEYGNCLLADCFKNTDSGRWLAENAHKYGYTLRYHKGKQEVSGYIFEPWHYRYVGIELAHELKLTGLSLEEFFELGAASAY